ncbi:MAG: helix-turn-helix domain-containing protein [Kiritimatiellaeota bacterium]|nr:helix-turn-helix domain-containing protein [Kiritimatiellota bacterium]
MNCKPGEKMDDKIFRHPLIRQLGALAADMAGLRLLIVYPSDEGWQQVASDARPDLKPAFCKLFQSTPEGAKHCRMCHILMSVAACSGGPREQRCHAGASVLVCPSANTASECVAVVSSCLFTHPESWAGTRVRGGKLGLDTEALKQAFFALPKLSPEQNRLLLAVMEAMSLAVALLRQHRRLETQAAKEPAGHRRPLDLKTFGEKMDAAHHGRGSRTSAAVGAPLLVRVVCELVQQRPGLPLSVKELAAAARVTPNHFTTLFHQHTGLPFIDYLTEQRMNYAKKLLGDVTLNINEIARLAGYDDPGYFARRFRQKTKVSPRVWRNRSLLKAQRP